MDSSSQQQHQQQHQHSLYLGGNSPDPPRTPAAPQPAATTTASPNLQGVTGLSNRKAMEIIINGLKGLLKEREENFRDHLEKRKKKAQVALQRLFHPYTLLTLTYIGFMIYNTHLLYTFDTSQSYQSTDAIAKLHVIDRENLIVQHLITIIVVLLLVLIDVYLRIQRLNFRVFNIDSKIQQVIEKYDPSKPHKESSGSNFVLNQDIEFSYYQNCFTWTLRDGEWQKIPNNTLAENDIIKLLPDDTAPALIGSLGEDDDQQQTPTENNIGAAAHWSEFTPTFDNVQKASGGMSCGDKPSKHFFNKGSKIVLQQQQLSRQHTLMFCNNVNSANTPQEAFEKSMKEYILFKVKKTPCVQDLTEYISNMESRKEYSKNLLYFSNVQKAERVVTIFQAIGWLICVTVNIAFIYTDNIIDYFDHHTYLPLVGLSFIAPQIFSVCEAWANALMITLFNSLQNDDYNRLFSSGKFNNKHIKKPNAGKQNATGGNPAAGGHGSNSDQSKKATTIKELNPTSLNKPLLRDKKRRRQQESSTWTFRDLMTCMCCRRNASQNKEYKGGKRRNSNSSISGGVHSHKHRKKSRKQKEMVQQVLKSDDFYEDYDFQNRGLRKNWSQFWEFYRSGCTHINNVFASLSCVSVFAFVDKEGIISEMAKYVDEMAVIDKKEQKQVIDLVHDSHVAHEESIYQFEKVNQYQENIQLLKTLGLSFMCAKNPKESDTQNEMIEIFSLPNTVTALDGQQQEQNQLNENIREDIGFHFHNALRQETEAHQDCVCALAKLIGHTDNSYKNYENLLSLWNIVENPQLLEETAQGADLLERGGKKEKDDKKHRSFDDQQRSVHSADDLQEKLKSEAALSFISDDTIKGGKPIFAAQKQHKKMLLERMSKYGHVVQSLVIDKATNKYQSFSRGEANIIFSMCSDYWNGEKIVPIKKQGSQIESHIKDILFQWQASDFVAIGFSYKPVTPDIQQLIQEKKLTEKTAYKYSEQLEQFQKNQIFLGIIGVKHHKKQEANKMFRSLEEAGIRGVLFSKEGVLETKSLAKELGIDSDWNAWISLSENPSDFTKLYNEDGHLILPYGINGIRKHIEDVDKIPLQVPMFCDCNAETTRQMFQIYQENGDVVACIGNIMNSENLHIFQQSNVAVGMRIEPSYRCYRCNGRISKIHHASNAYTSFKQNPWTQPYKPNKYEELSAAINSLACTFVFDANTNIYCFFSVFREARRLRESVEQASLLALFTYMNVFLVLLVDLYLGTYHYCNQLEVLYILLIFVPVFSLACMSRPTKNSVMKRHVLSPKYLQYLDFAIFMIKSNISKVILSTLLMYAVRLLYFSEAIQLFQDRYPLAYTIAFDDKYNEHTSGQRIKYLLYGEWYVLKRNYIYWEQTMQLEHKFNFCFLLVILTYLCIGYESAKSTLLYKFTSNLLFRVVLFLQLLFIVLYYVLSTTTVFQDRFESDKAVSGLYYPSYRVWLCAVGGLVAIATVEELTKKRIRKLYERDHNRLSIFFSTKLGMWSPR